MYNVHAKFTVDLGQSTYDKDVYAYDWPSWNSSSDADYLCTGKGTVMYAATLNGDLYLTKPQAPGKAGVVPD